MKDSWEISRTTSKFQVFYALEKKWKLKWNISGNSDHVVCKMFLFIDFTTRLHFWVREKHRGTTALETSILFRGRALLRPPFCPFILAAFCMNCTQASVRRVIDWSLCETLCAMQSSLNPCFWPVKDKRTDREVSSILLCIRGNALQSNGSCQAKRFTLNTEKVLKKEKLKKKTLFHWHFL